MFKKLLPLFFVAGGLVAAINAQAAPHGGGAIPAIPNHYRLPNRIPSPSNQG